MAETPRTITVRVGIDVAAYIRPLLQARLRFLQGDGLNSLSDHQERVQKAEQALEQARADLESVAHEEQTVMTALAALEVPQ